MNRTLSGHITTLASIFPRTGSTSSTPSADSQRSPIPLLPSGPGFTAGARRPAGLRGDQRLRRAFAAAGCARRSAGAPPQPAACLAFCAVAEPPQDRPRRRRHACPDGASTASVQLSAGSVRIVFSCPVSSTFAAWVPSTAVHAAAVINLFITHSSRSFRSVSALLRNGPIDRISFSAPQSSVPTTTALLAVGTGLFVTGEICFPPAHLRPGRAGLHRGLDYWLIESGPTPSKPANMPLSLARPSVGTGWITSQCSTIMPSSMRNRS